MKILLLLALAVLVSGCLNLAPIPPLVPFAASGSKGDGIIIMSTGTLSALQTLAGEPTIDWNAAQRKAAARCAAWGYSHADGFAGVVTKCARWNLRRGECAQREYERTYQCTGTKKE